MTATDYPDWTKNVGVNSGANQVVLLDLAAGSISIPLDASGNGTFIQTISGADVPPTASVPTPAHAVAVVTDILVWDQPITNFRVVDKATNQAYFQLGESYLLQDYFNEIFPILTARGEIDVVIGISGGQPNTDLVLTGGLSVIAYTASIPPQPPQSTLRNAITNALLQGLFASGVLADPYLQTVLNDVAEIANSIGYPQSNLQSTSKGISIADSMAPADTLSVATTITAAQGVPTTILTAPSDIILRGVQINESTATHEYQIDVNGDMYTSFTIGNAGMGGDNTGDVFIAAGGTVDVIDQSGASVGYARCSYVTI